MCGSYQRAPSHISLFGLCKSDSLKKGCNYIGENVDTHCRMFRLGWREERGGGGTEGEQRGRNEGGREKCASLNTHT